MSQPRKPTQSDELIALLSRQCDLYRELKVLSGRQRGLISGDRPDVLPEVLQQRPAHVRELAKLNQKLSSFRSDWEATMSALADDAKQRVTELLEQINALLSGIIETDKQDGTLLSARKQIVAAELSGLSGGRIANKCYARSTSETGSHSADLTG